jgi:hypothetical protein
MSKHIRRGIAMLTWLLFQLFLLLFLRVSIDIDDKDALTTYVRFKLMNVNENDDQRSIKIKLKNIMSVAPVIVRLTVLRTPGKSFLHAVYHLAKCILNEILNLKRRT